MNTRYGIVYMGSKEKILDLINYMFEREYKKKTFVDLFTGGFSVSSFALHKTNFNVISNDLNKYVIGLYKELLDGGKDFEQVKYDWISRVQFEMVRDYPDSFPDWYVGYVLNVWSFGCNQKDYLYAKDLEENKKALHQAIVWNDFRLINENPLFEGFKISSTITNIDFKEHPLKRLAFMEKFKKFIKTKDNDELKRLEQLESLSQMLHLNAIEANIKFKHRLELHSKDWKELYDKIPTDILEDAFIYCDPPYENTKQYLFGGDFDYEAFWDWFRNCPYSVYVSSYTAPEDIEPINFIPKQVNLDNGNRSNERVTTKKKAIENIYWNKKGNAVPTMLDLLFNQDL